jgi:hypothetical protein
VGEWEATLLVIILVSGSQASSSFREAERDVTLRLPQCHGVKGDVTSRGVGNTEGSGNRGCWVEWNEGASYERGGG